MTLHSGLGIMDPMTSDETRITHTFRVYDVQGNDVAEMFLNRKHAEWRAAGIPGSRVVAIPVEEDTVIICEEDE